MAALHLQWAHAADDDDDDDVTGCILQYENVLNI